MKKPQPKPLRKLSIREKLQLMKQIEQRNEERRKEFKRKNSGKQQD